MPKARYVGGFLLAVLLEMQSCGSELPECFVEFAAYDNAGKDLENWQVTGITELVRFSRENETVDLLATDELEFRPVIVGKRIYFHKRWISLDPWRVELRNGEGQSVEKEITLYSCEQQRESFVVDENLPTGDMAVDWFERSGRLKGCSLDKDWWIRSSPLFAIPPRIDPDLFSTFDGTIEAATGEFTIRARFGVRHMLVVGRGNEPVKVFAVNLDAGSADHDLGEFDLSDACPTLAR